ncbi:hypothetical protein [Oryzibacter oryziterrae]|uniref:hypothetical protein n=1 Tax=Oryzibacter oryziterrae TaxID=2766474 RepID=UPI001F2DF4EB|nr:hypothetical protein [Oryzibacter oryziterrae]
MWDFSIARAIGLMVRTMPFILTRMAIYFGITFAYIVATGIGAAIGYGIGHVGSDPAAFGFWGGAAGFVFVSIGVYWIREYILYIVKAGHIAVLVKLMDGETLPDGQGQVAYAKTVVTERFGEASVLFALDQLIKGVIGAITGLIGGIASFIPIPGLDGLVRFVNAVIRMSMTYVDEVVLAYNIRIGSTNPWETSCDGLVLYAQNAKTIVKNAIWLTIFLYIFAGLVFVLILGPMAALFYLFPGDASVWAVLAAIVFAWAFKAAVLEPFAIACLMEVYFKAIEGQTPDPLWDRRLSDASAKFRDLKDKAFGAGGQPATA